MAARRPKNWRMCRSPRPCTNSSKMPGARTSKDPTEKPSGQPAEDGGRRPDPPRGAASTQHMGNSLEVVVEAAETNRAGNIRTPFMTEGLFRLITLSAAGLLLLSLLGIALLLLLQSSQSIHAFGVDFLLTDIWNPVKQKFGALAAIYGTLMTSLIAMLVGVPLAFGVTFFLAELCPFA